MLPLPAGFKTQQKFTPVTVSFAKKQLPLFTARTLHSTAPTAAEKKNPFSDVSVDPSKLIALSNTAIAKVQTASTEQLFHWSQYGLAGLAPAALILSPSFLNFPVDFALGLIIPVHMQIGLVGVVEDYIPRNFQALVRFIVAVASVCTAIGLLKINLCGAGITESVKSAWRAPKDVKKLKA